MSAPSNLANALTAPSRAAAATLNALRVRAGARTHVGNVRKNNEDQYLIGDLSSALKIRDATLCPVNHVYFGLAPLSLFIVADGMGGHAGGEHASALAVTSVEAFTLRALGHIGTLGMQGPTELLRECFQVADGAVIEAARGNASLAGMGTTMTVVVVGGSEAHVAHAGDSRAYLYHERQLIRLTRDHTVAEALRERGIGDSDAHDQPMEHIITNAVGGGTAGVEPDVARIDLHGGDRILLCTDGLSDMVDDAKIAELLGTGRAPAEMASDLVDAALAGGGVDNVTALVATFDAE